MIQVVPLYPEVGHVEMDPEAIWEGFITVVKGAVQGTVSQCPVATHTKEIDWMRFILHVNICNTYLVNMLLTC